MLAGYQIIDLKGVDLYGTEGAGVTIKGLYNKIKGSRKPILLENIVIDGEEFKNAFVNFYAAEGVCIAPIMLSMDTEVIDAVYVNVSDEDLVTISTITVHGTEPDAKK